jgi:hypothetical protein
MAIYYLLFAFYYLPFAINQQQFLFEGAKVQRTTDILPVKKLKNVKHALFRKLSTNFALQDESKTNTHDACPDAQHGGKCTKRRPAL